jgi:hypothetical protein
MRDTSKKYALSKLAQLKTESGYDVTPIDTDTFQIIDNGKILKKI